MQNNFKLNQIGLSPLSVNEMKIIDGGCESELVHAVVVAATKVGSWLKSFAEGFKQGFPDGVDSV